MEEREMNPIAEGFLDSVLALCEAVGIKMSEFKNASPSQPMTEGQKKAPRPAATETESTNKN